MALFKRKPREGDIEAYPTMTPNFDSPAMGPAGYPTGIRQPSMAPALPAATYPAPMQSQSPMHMEILQNKIDMLISKIDALKSTIDMLQQRISQIESQQRQTQQPARDERVDLYGSSASGSETQNSGEQQQGSDYSSGGSGWQF